MKGKDLKIRHVEDITAEVTVNALEVQDSISSRGIVLVNSKVPRERL
jgi:hypothetical protein